MTLDEISERYRQNLVSFFSDESVIEEIYREQYGEENYTANSAAYQEQYHHILANTVFIPYITIEHLEQFIASQRISHNEQYMNKNFAEEIKKLRILNLKRESIINQYTAELFASIEKILPEYNIASRKMPKDMEEVQKLINEVKEYLETNRKSIFSSFKNNKISKLLEQYDTGVKEKVLIETSTYFQHRRNMPKGKYYINLINDMLKGGAFVQQQIGKDENRNCRYIFLPILSYESEEEYLKYALHELMHVAKEKIEGNTYRSGLYVRQMSDDKKTGTLYSNKSRGKILLENIKWLIFKKRMKAEDVSQSFDTGDSEFEEVTHHFQVRKVLERLKQKKALKRIYMPYKKEAIARQQMVYEGADEITEKFMGHFSEDIQKVNSGELKLRRFKSKVGRKYFELLGKVFETGDRSILQGKGRIKICQPKQASRTMSVENIVGEPYVTMGNELIENMVMRAERQTVRAEKRAELLAKTKNVLGMDVIEAGKSIMKKLKERRKTSQAVEEER